MTTQLKKRTTALKAVRRAEVLPGTLEKLTGIELASWFEAY